MGDLKKLGWAEKRRVGQQAPCGRRERRQRMKLEEPGMGYNNRYTCGHNVGEHLILVDNKC